MLLQETRDFLLAGGGLGLHLVDGILEDSLGLALLAGLPVGVLLLERLLDEFAHCAADGTLMTGFHFVCE